MLAHTLTIMDLLQTEIFEILNWIRSNFNLTYELQLTQNFHSAVITLSIFTTANAFLCVLKHDIKVAIGSGLGVGGARGLTRRPCNGIAQSGG